MSLKKKLFISFSCLFVVLLISVVYLFFPLMGKPHTEIWSAKQDFDLNSIQTIEKQEGQDFKILQISDTQLWSKPKDNKIALQMVKDLAEETSPDLIVCIGDNVSGILIDRHLKNFINTLEETGIPWAPIFGNHDNEVKVSLNWQGDRFLEAEHCLFKKGPSNLYGCGNYLINITENGQPFHTLYMFDNGRYFDYGDDLGGKAEIYMGYEQIAWYRWNAQGIAKTTGEQVPSTAFMHFPQPEMEKAIEMLAVKNEQTGFFDIPMEYGFGYCTAIPRGAPVNSGFFDACLENGTQAMFFGHCHENTASIVYQGIRMTFGMKTGPSPEPWNDAANYGGTLITIKDKTSDVQVEHVIRASK